MTQAFSSISSAISEWLVPFLVYLYILNLCKYDFLVCQINLLLLYGFYFRIISIIMYVLLKIHHVAIPKYEMLPIATKLNKNMSFEPTIVVASLYSLRHK